MWEICVLFSGRFFRRGFFRFLRAGVQGQLIEELLQILFDYEQARIEILLDAGVDAIVHRAWYEVTDFWTPAAYRRFLKPLLQREVHLVQDAGAFYTYIMTKGFAEHYTDFLDLGIDVLCGVDPVQGGADLAEMKAAIGDRICLWGGMNSHVTLGGGTEEEIRAAVRGAVSALAPAGGFVLFPVDQITLDMPARNVEILIDEWRRAGEGTTA